MNKYQFGGALAFALLLAACGENQNAARENRLVSNGAPAAEPANEIYSASGKVTAISGDEVTIEHGPVEGIGWPAMTMSFKIASPDIVHGVRVGDRVSFSFTQDSGAYTLTSLSRDK